MESDSLYIARDCLTSNLAKAWEHLRGSPLRAHDGQPAGSRQRKAADDSLKVYAKIVEEGSKIQQSFRCANLMIGKDHLSRKGSVQRFDERA
jgi:hypothetical protein